MCSCCAAHTPYVAVVTRPAELEQLVCGGRVVDLGALEAATHYDDGYHKNSAPVRWFWEVRDGVGQDVCGSSCGAGCIASHGCRAALQSRLCFVIRK